MKSDKANVGPPGPPGPQGPQGPPGHGVPDYSHASPGSLLVMGATGASWSPPNVNKQIDVSELLPRLLKALGLSPGDRLVVRTSNGEERELPLECLDESAAAEVLES